MSDDSYSPLNISLVCCNFLKVLFRVSVCDFLSLQGTVDRPEHFALVLLASRVSPAWY